jgi:hypothetical protein
MESSAPSLGTFVQLLAIGSQDVHTTVAPTHSFFATGQRTWHTYDAFTKDPEINEFNEPQPSLDNDSGPSSVFTCTLKRTGDLIVGLTLVVELPELDSQYQYVKDVGYKLIKEIAIGVNGVELDRLTGTHMLVKAVMSNAYNAYTLFSNLVNGVSINGVLETENSMQDSAATSHKLIHVPIPVWFGRAQVSSGFPLASLVTSDAVIKLTLNSLSTVVNNASEEDLSLRPKMSLLTDNVYLDPAVAFALIRSGPTKSIFQQNMHQEYISSDNPIQRIELVCNRNVRRLLWLVTAPDDPLSILRESVMSSRLIMEGHNLMDQAPLNQETGKRADGKYSNLVQPHFYGVSSMPGVYSQTFALRAADVPYGGSVKKTPMFPWAAEVPPYESPFVDQPTGAFDFSLTRNFLELSLHPDVPDGSTVHIFFEAYNVLEQSLNEIRPMYLD